MSEQLTLIEEAFGLTVVEGENLQLTLDGGNGPAGPAGAAGAAGPNTVTTSTSTTLNGYIFGNGTTISGATAASSAATPSTLVVRTSGGAASFTGITNNGALTLSTGTTFTYGAGIAAAHRTALGLGSLATQSGTFSGTHSGDSSGTNTGDQDLSNFLSRRTILEVNGTDAPISQSLVEQGYLSNGRRVWANGDGGTLAYEEGIWVLTQLDSGSSFIYQASKTSTSYEPWLLTGWTVSTGSGEPTFVLDPAEPLGNGVIIALDLPADTNGGFLTAGTGGTLPITRGGTGATTAPLARTALGSGATGDALFTAASASAARTTLELGNLATLNGPLAVASGGTGTTNGSITGTGALTFTAGGSNQNINLTPSGTGLINITGNSGNTVIPVFRATNNYSGGTVPGYVNTFECLAPNLSAGNTIYATLGVSASTNNRGGISFYYAGSGSANNYMAFGSFFGATGVLAAFPNGGVAIAASGTPINPGAGCLSVSGNVGIGTTSPSTKVHVATTGTSSITALRLDSGSGGYAGFQMYDGNAGNSWAVGHEFGATSNASLVFGYGAVGSEVVKASVSSTGIFNGAGLDVTGNTVRLRTARTPASATAAGNAGDICWDANYIYVCTATNTWKRTAISTWP